MQALDKKSFKLPYVDSATYRELMRLSLRYSKQLRSYSAEDLDEARSKTVLALLSKILHEPVCFEQSKESVRDSRVDQTCLICGKRFLCSECRYFESCETKDIPSKCICGKCLKEGKTLPTQ